MMSFVQRHASLSWKIDRLFVFFIFLMGEIELSHMDKTAELRVSFTSIVVGQGNPTRGPE